VDGCGSSSPMTDPRESGSTLDPKYDDNGLLTAVATDARTGEVLMVAHMNGDALAATLDSGEAVFWSRSRKRLWKKGESSGHILRVVEARVDCDQDAVWLLVEPAGPACHTGARSCFYRRIEDGALVRVEAEPFRVSNA
jgi:phosphoribosyl-AMP cyclohydrolase